MWRSRHASYAAARTLRSSPTTRNRANLAHFAAEARGHAAPSLQRLRAFETTSVRSSVSMDMPQTRYAKTPDGISIAYQVMGDGPVDVLWLPGWHGNLEVLWEQSLTVSFFARLAAFARLIIHDRRATGLSDRATTLPDLGTRVDDAWTVLDAVGSRSTVIFGSGDGGHTAIMFAATHPKKTRSLVLYATSPRTATDADYPWGFSERERAHDLQMAREAWGTEAYASMVIADEAPSKATDREFIRWYAKVMRHWVSPTSAEALHRMFFETDVRAILPTITVPTLVLAREWEHSEEDEYVASQIPGALFRRLAGKDVMTYLDPGDLTEAIREFVGAEAPSAETGSMLRTVLFIDIVGSTERAAALGDDAWRDVIERHRSAVREALGRFGGTEVDTAGDGLFAAFGAPAAAVRCAAEIVRAARELDIEVRAGVHAGEVTSIEGKVAGIATHIGARVCALAGASEVLVSRTVKDLVAGSGLTFEDAGVYELKGIPESWQLFRCVS
jgi:class 3 adenylate cyclase